MCATLRYNNNSRVSKRYKATNKSVLTITDTGIYCRSEEKRIRLCISGHYVSDLSALAQMYQFNYTNIVTVTVIRNNWKATQH